MFERARIKLTFWYFVIITILLATSSIAAINAESRAFDRIEQALSDKVQRPKLTALLSERLDQFESNFTKRLLFLDGMLLIIGAFGSYFLSGLTLSPIQKMLKEQEEFAADASHELKTPLTTIAMEIESAERTNSKLTPENRLLFQSIKEEVKRMKNIVNGLLVLVRQPSYTTSKEVTAFDLSELTDEVVSKMKKIALTKKLNLTSKFDTKIKVRANSDEIREVLVILIDNAIKYSRPKDNITISAKKVGKKAILQVSDTGVGIPKKDLPLIFHRFYRANGNDQEKGAGLGLAIAKKIVESYKGEISATSSQGTGSTFTIILSS
ncbi:hypothetical protein A3A76_05710 [Candidatus Woesebacteria bacterium RIFCSPLOWO2_01_FULL_39_23]|uniref:histidine kinase n=1 Tax=Candidatus Woesebacteria bacterium RIFCSPHIGHO2_01_FULL_40_22 TaxID=1802499 RepID=A0A1F7YJW9_9BACT|nr:MAG: hypothetical protein A2141_02040 [Candidatus Woesebacteria bacterium RBG_16_40_11]OGM26898.1 MAG: hypothetical protein A2628_05650 [Candidatus Woesebacteria bacterium RIFCSPHIGHO2_01_FULL_40_22]OGM63173.1 MAG: hypothetical protein A3A76_05710 [Candidatus Woesebacteria bacterium RIFCSPLOWO2_01_FULL_39_23]